MKGIDKLREKLPDYPGKRIAIFPLKGILGIIFGYNFLIVLDVIPRIFTDVAILATLEPFMPLLGSFLIGGLALWLIRRIWNLRDRMKNAFGDLAYQKMISTGVVGIFLITTLIFHAFTSIRSLPPGPPINNLTTQWSQSLFPVIGIPIEIDIVLRLGISVFFIIIGTLLVRSAIMTFGIDYMTVVYLYFPEESEVQENEIYSVVRHPAYLSGVLFGLAALFFRFSVYSIIMCFIVYLVFKLHIRREEKELVERFGNSYVEYMNKTPALYVSPRYYRKFFKFLAGK